MDQVNTLDCSEKDSGVERAAADTNVSRNHQFTIDNELLEIKRAEHFTNVPMKDGCSAHSRSQRRPKLRRIPALSRTLF
jgi:hypothetical protein